METIRPKKKNKRKKLSGAEYDRRRAQSKIEKMGPNVDIEQTTWDYNDCKVVPTLEEEMRLIAATGAPSQFDLTNAVRRKNLDGNS